LWNIITTVYSISSTGELISFLTGLIIFITFLRQILAHQSRIHFTDTLLELLDDETPLPIFRIRHPEDSKRKSNLAVRPGYCYIDELYSLAYGHELVFWVRRGSFRTRRRSVDIVTQEDIDLDKEHVIGQCRLQSVLSSGSQTYHGIFGISIKRRS
jgi:hypothetical protein